MDYTAIISDDCKNWIHQISTSSTRGLSTTSLQFQIDPTVEYDQRKGEIIIKSGDKSENVTIYQAGDGILSLTNKEFNLTSSEQDIAIEVSSNFEYEVTMPDVDWISEIQSRGISTHTINLHIAENTAYEDRTATIRLHDKNSDVSEEVIINQSQKNVIEFETREYEFDENGGTFTIDINSNVNYEIGIEEDWVSVLSDTRALVKRSHSFKVLPLTENFDRKTKIKFSDSVTGITEEIVVKQNRSIFFDSDNYELFEGDTRYLNLTNRTDQSVTFASSDETVVIIGNNGQLEAVSKGRATITATTQDGKHKCICEVLVNDITFYMQGESLGGSVVVINGLMPDICTYGGLMDSVASYAKQMGLKVIHTYDQPFLQADRGNGGFIDGPNHEKKRYHFTDKDLSTREYADLLAKDGLILGRTSISNSMAPGTKDCSPVPSDSICILHRRFLTADLNETDTMIYIDDPTHLEEIACWEGHTKELNMVKIGKELIHYLGVTKEKPYRLMNVTRGYWGTQATVHEKGEAVDKLQPAVGGAYTGLIPNLELQDELARHYADICKNSGLGMFDYDGQEFFFHTGFGAYSVKRFFRNMFAQAKQYGLPDIRFTGATLSEGSWHYQSIWNVGGGLDIYDVKKRVWGSTTSQGKDLRDVTYANFFPSSFGGNFPITAESTVEDYEHIEATAIGYGCTYAFKIGQKDVESCPQKYAIFRVIRTWEEARRADAFPTYIKKMLQDPSLSWRLEKKEGKEGWTLYQMVNGQKGKSFDLYPKQSTH